MVFHFRCFSFGDVEGAETCAQANTTSVDNFYTAQSDFDGRPSSQNVSYTNPRPRSGPGVPTLGMRPGTLRLFSLAELKAATSNFDASSKIGEGGFGSVHRCTIKSLEYPYKEITVAVKRGKRGSQGHNQWVTEVNVLGEIEHPNLVKLVGYCAEDDGNEDHLLLVYEYMPKKSLDDHLSAQSVTTLPWSTRLKIAHDAATGLTYLHEGMNHQIIFRDFKPSNILLDHHWNARLSDFGFARLGPPEGRTHVSTTVVGTKGYAAPEYVQTGRLTSKSDVWSYGVFLEELITGRRPPVQNNPNNKYQRLGWVKCCYSCAGKPKLKVDPRLEGKYSEKSVQELAFIANKCLAKEPKSRPKMSEVLQMVRKVIELEGKQLPNGGNTNETRISTQVR